MSWISYSFLLCCLVGGIASLKDVAFPMPDWELLPEHCDPGRGKGRIEWIILQRQADYGWGYHTHHANIALAVHEYRGTGTVEEMATEMEKMGAQLEFEVTKALFRNASSLIHANDLALYIHALLATNRDPRNFHGYDLVEDLLHRVHDKKQVHPFLVLALCNARAVTSSHLDKITHYAKPDHAHELTVDFRELEYKALTLKALECGRRDGLTKFGPSMKAAVECLIRRQNRTTGSFGNVFTTSLSFQALTAADEVVKTLVREGLNDWNSIAALKYLEKEAYINVNMVKAYYIEMALHAKKFNFIRDIHNIHPSPRRPAVDNRINVKYTVRNSLKDHYFTANLKVNPGSHFFGVMSKAAELGSANFQFSSNNKTYPMIYEVAGTPNDAEENMFWRICQYKTAPVQQVIDYDGSPATLFVHPGDHIALYYSNSQCRQQI